jgi:hypothetical protein
MEKLAFTRACLSDVRVIMAIMCAPLVELSWIPTLEYLLPGACGACGQVLLCQAVNDAASQDLDAW